MQSFLDHKIASKLKELYALKSFDDEFKFIYDYLPKSSVIQKLETSNLLVNEQVNMSNQASTLVKDNELMHNFDYFFATIPDLIFFTNYFGAISYKKYFTFASLILYWVERSFQV